jgi:hypothetical protein
MQTRRNFQKVSSGLHDPPFSSNFILTGKAYGLTLDTHKHLFPFRRVCPWQHYALYGHRGGRSVTRLRKEQWLKSLR